MPFTVPTIELADGRVMPLLAWGNADIPGEGKDKTAIDRASQALSKGYAHLDTAEGYDNAPFVGEFLASFDPSGDTLFLTSKVSTPHGSPDNGPVPVTEIRSKILTIIEQYGRQPDVLLAHNPYLTESITELWAVLDEMKDSGELTASLGISNYHPRHLEEVLRVAKHKPVVHQLEVHPYTLSHIQPVLDNCAKNDIAITSYGPLAPFSDHPTGGPCKPILEAIANKLSSETGKNIDPSQALVLWLRTKKITPIIGSHNEQRLKRYADTQALRDLTADEVAEVDTAGAKVYFRKFDEHYKTDDFPPPKHLPEDL